jgi:hypothetical protein
MNLAQSIAKALQAGYSDAEIADYIGKDPNMGSKVATARKAGYSDGEIVQHLANPSMIDQAKDFGEQTLIGMKRSAANVADAVGSVVGAGTLGRMSRGNPFGLPTLTDVGANLFSRLNHNDPQARSTAGEYGRTLGESAVNAAAPGSAPARVANVVVPALATEAAGQLARRNGAGPMGEQVARAAGGVVGAGVASVRLRNPFSPEATPAETLATRARQDPAAMQQRATDYRAAGISPTLTDVVDDAGRGQIRAAANRPTPGRDQANLFARQRTLDLPNRIGNQARANLSADPRTPAQIADELGQTRATSANAAFGAVRGDALPADTEMAQALQNPMGREAIAEAARRERDPAVRTALEQLGTWARGEHSTGTAPQLTVGMADRISRTLLGRGQAAARQGDNDLAATFNSLGAAVRNPARAASPGYRGALEGYAEQSRLMDAAGQGEDFLRRNTDEFVANTPAAGQPGNELARATARRAVERAAGENPSAAPGVARRLAEAPEQQARNAHLLGPQGANQFQQGMRLEAQAVDNANAIAPRTGSPTHLNDTDAARAANIFETGRRVVRQDWVGLGLDWLRSRGISDQDAEALVRMATDPAQTDQAIALITRRLGPEGARPFIQMRRAGMLGTAALTGLGSAQPSNAQGQPGR